MFYVLVLALLYISRISSSREEIEKTFSIILPLASAPPGKAPLVGVVFGLFKLSTVANKKATTIRNGRLSVRLLWKQSRNPVPSQNL
jgi:hypothetical protein